MDGGTVRTFPTTDKGTALFESNHRMHAGTFNLMFRIPSDSVSAYVVGGPGFYHRSVDITTPSVGFVTVCDPWWYICYPAAVSVDQIVGSRSTTDFGFNIGGGATFGHFLVDARFHYAFGPEFTVPPGIPRYQARPRRAVPSRQTVTTSRSRLASDSDAGSHIMRRRSALLMVAATCLGSSVAWAQDAETRPATPTFLGDRGLWFVPTAEVTPAWSFSIYRTALDHNQGFTNLSFFPVTASGGFGQSGGVRLAAGGDAHRPRSSAPLSFKATRTTAAS